MHVVEGAAAKQVVIEGGRATGVVARIDGKTELMPADLVVLAAGGLGTPVILDASGIPASPTLFVDQCYDVLEAVGVPREKAFFGTLNAGHPGGCFPLTKAEAETLHHDVLPVNLYVADASLLPRSIGNPPILTIMALAKRVARLAAHSVG